MPLPPAGVVDSQAYARVVLQFSSEASAASFSKAKLKFNKDFAYSLTFDDGTADHYQDAFFLINGGHSSDLNRDFSGLKSTDGCGNDVPFRAASAWNSTNVYHYIQNDGYDPHVDSSSGYVTWSQLNTLISAGWDVLNHSFAHLDAGSGVSFDPGQQIASNTAKIFSMTGYAVTDFVIPSGDVDYRIPAFSLGLKGVYNQAYGLPGTGDGFRVDSNIPQDQFEMYRNYVSDFGVSTVNNHLDSLAARSSSSAHYWWQSFTHSVNDAEFGLQHIRVLANASAISLWKKWYRPSLGCRPAERARVFNHSGPLSNNDSGKR